WTWAEAAAARSRATRPNWMLRMKTRDRWLPDMETPSLDILLLKTAYVSTNGPSPPLPPLSRPAPPVPRERGEKKRSVAIGGDLCLTPRWQPWCPASRPPPPSYTRVSSLSPLSRGTGGAGRERGVGG